MAPSHNAAATDSSIKMSSATRAGSFRRRRCETLPPDRGVLQRGPRPRCSPHSHHRRRAPRNPPRVDLHNGGRPAGHNLTAFGLAVEIGDWRRFMGNSISSFVGLVPTEYSSGSSRAQGSITKTGHGHVRRLLVCRVCLAPSARLPAKRGPAGPLGVGTGGRASPWRRRQPQTPPPVGQVHRTQEAAHHRDHRNRP